MASQPPAPAALRIRAVALQFNVEAVAKQSLEALHQVPSDELCPCTKPPMGPSGPPDKQMSPA
jgi:hypothetical protein